MNQIPTERRDQFIAAWHTPLSVRAIAREMGVSSNVVAYHFKRLRKEGLVPDRPRTNVRYPRSGGNRTRRAGGGDPLALGVEEVRVGPTDRLLEALRREHGNDPLRRLDTSYAAVVDTPPTPSYR